MAEMTSVGLAGKLPRAGASERGATARLRGRGERTRIALLAAAALLVAACHTLTSVTPNPAVPGDTLTITGANFGATQGTSQVLYDGAPLAIVSWSASTIVATLPAVKPSATYTLSVVVNGETVSVPHTLNGPPAWMSELPYTAYSKGKFKLTDGTYTRCLTATSTGVYEQPCDGSELQNWELIVDPGNRPADDAMFYNWGRKQFLCADAMQALVYKDDPADCHLMVKAADALNGYMHWNSGYSLLDGAGKLTLDGNALFFHTRVFVRRFDPPYTEQSRIYYEAEGGTGYTMTADTGFPLIAVDGRTVRSVDAAARQGQSGYMLKGPSLSLPTQGPHRFSAYMRCSTPRAGSGTLCPVGVLAVLEVWDVTDNKQLITFDIDADDGEGGNRIMANGYLPVTAPGFFYAPPGHQIEYRVWWTGVTDLYVDRVVVNLIDYQ